MLKNDYVKASVVCILAGLLTASVASAIPTNGDFSISDPVLFGWTVESGIVTDGGGYAFFEEDPVYIMSSLINDQPFTLPEGELELSFEVTMDYIGGPPNSDAFTVSLLDAGFNPLISYDPGVTWFYSLEPGAAPVTVATVMGNKVILDVSSFAGQNVLLAFDFFSEDDGVTTTVKLDNVNVLVIPAPGALILAGIGACLVVRLRKSKTMK